MCITCCWLCMLRTIYMEAYPDSKIHAANIGPTWPSWAPCGPREPCYLGSRCYWRCVSPVMWLSMLDDPRLVSISEDVPSLKDGIVLIIMSPYNLASALTAAIPRCIPSSMVIWEFSLTIPWLLDHARYSSNMAYWILKRLLLIRWHRPGCLLASSPTDVARISMRLRTI